MEARHTFLLTDIVESTAKWSRHPEAMQRDLARHDAIVRDAIFSAGGNPFKHTGDGMFACFEREEDAVAAARRIQQDIAAYKWDVPGGLLLKIGVSTGPAVERAGDYFGPAMNLISRLVEMAHGGQSLFLPTEVDRLPSGIRNLGPHCLPKIEGTQPIYQILRDGEPDFPDLDVDKVVRYDNLPHAGSEIIGRDAELARLESAVRTNPVVTLTGPGGVGKSRLALELAERLRSEFRHGIIWTDLCCLECDGDIESTLWNSIAATEPEPPDLHKALLSRLRPLSLAIILDGAEPIVADVARVVRDILSDLPSVRFIVTSREPLGLPGEAVTQVHPLTLPATHDPVDIAASAAVKLFLNRAEASDFQPNPSQLETISRMVCQLEGIPLAIEIAASRLRTMSLEDLCRRLGDRLGLLQTARRTGEDRHRTLQATFEWSYDLLSRDERAAFCLLGVFSARFTLEAAVALLRDKFGAHEAEDLLQSLVEKSMAVFDRTRPSGPYVFLDSLRQYSALKRSEEGLTETAAIAHARVAGEFARGASLRIRAAEAETVMVEIRERLPDLLQAAHRMVDNYTSDLAEIVRLIWRYWYRQGRIREAMRDLETLWPRLPSDGLEPVELDARRTYGWALYLSGRTEDSAAIASRALEDAERANSPTDVAQARNLLGGSLLGTGQVNEAIQQYLLALEADESAIDPLARSRIKVNLASAYLEVGRYDDAVVVLSESLARFREVGDRYGQAWVMVSMGILFIVLGRLDEADALMRDSFELRQEMGDQRGQAYALLGMAEIRLKRGEEELARQLWAQASQKIIEIEDNWAITEALLVRAKIGVTANEPEIVGRIIKVLETHPSGVHIGQTLHDRIFMDQARAMAVVPSGPAEDPFEIATDLWRPKVPLHNIHI